MSKRIVLLVLVVFLTFSFVLAGCKSEGSQGTTTTTRATTRATTTAAADAFAKKLEITWMPFSYQTSADQDSEMIKLLNEKFNVDIKVVQVDWASEEQHALYFAEGGTADAIDMRLPIYRYLEQDLIRDITIDMLDSYAPSIMSVLREINPQEIIDRYLYIDGKVYVLPRASYGPWGWIMAVRKDWLDNLGIANAPTTLDEYYQVAKRFANDDPDQNSQKDTYAMPLFGTKANVFFAAYGIARNTFTTSDGKVLYSSVTNEYKDALKMLKKWYDEGLIDPEFVTDTRENVRSKWADGKYGFYVSDVWWWRSNVSDNLQNLLTDNDPDAEILFMQPLQGPGGAFTPGWPPDMYSNAIAFGKDTSDEKVERIMRIRNAAAESQQSDGEFFKRVYYGVEGVDYEVKDGIITRLDPWPVLTRKGIACFFSLQAINKELFYKNDVPEQDKYYYDIFDQSPKIIQGTDLPTMKQAETWKDRGAEIETLVNEFYMNAITGSVDIDSGWDAYVSSLNNAGLQNIINEYQAIIDN